jgi:GH25 family lysozyme M1 (1,4-beta-N-acetylmuramidase)
VDENFLETESGEVEYYQDGVKISHKGIDISKYQGSIDWNKVKQDGVEFAFLRLGLRGYESGKLVLDETYVNNAVGASDAGVGVGVYFFTQAITVEEAIEEADFVLENIKDYNITYPVVFDIEDLNSEDARTKNMTQEENTAIAIAFCERIKEAGYKPMIYGNLRTFLLMLDMEQLEGYEKWFAYYDLPVYFPYAYSILQYSEKGTVDGITEPVDLNISFE